MKIFIVIVLLLLSGCSTMVYGPTQAVPINTVPPDSLISVDGNQPDSNIGILILERRKPHIIRVQRDGYKSRVIIISHHASSSMWRNLVWIHPVGWVAGVITDLITGGGYDLTPEYIDITLDKETGS